MMNKSLSTNLIALAVTAGGYFSPLYSDIILMTGLFALSGAITNWMAVHMLFDKVPFLYGSGVIPNRFEEFKAGIKQLIIQEFFTHEHIEQFFKNNNPLENISGKINFDHVFSGLVEAIEGSPLGGILGMIGGKAALQPLKEPVTEKLKGIIAELTTAHPEKNDSDNLTSVLIHQVEDIIDARLEELTPGKVKSIIQNMIRKHLGWLVVWGGVFGGVIGLGAGIIKYLN